MGKAPILQTKPIRQIELLRLGFSGRQHVLSGGVRQCQPS
jgi:hypothetical protein